MPCTPARAEGSASSCCGCSNALPLLNDNLTSHQLTPSACPPPPSRQRLQAEAGSGGQQYVGVLWQFLRMRQACNHPLLVKGAVHAHELAAAEVRRTGFGVF